MKNRREDAIWISIVLAVALFMLWRANGHALDPIIDTGRDLYIPERIRGGLKLYRDILYYYPPLTPYLLALVTAITGSSLFAYTMIGSAIALLTIAAIYAICRAVAPPAAAGSAALLFASCSIYSISGRTSNYLFPYAHAATLAMFFFVAGSACIGIWAYVDHRARWLAPGLLFLLTASWTKLEYVAFALVIVAIAAIVHRLSIRWTGAYVAVGIASLVIVDRFFADAPEGQHWLFDNVLASSLLRGQSARYFYRQVSGFDAFGANLLLAAFSAGAFAFIVVLIATSERWSSKAMTIVISIGIAIVAIRSANDFFRGWAILQLVLIPFALRKPREPLLLLLAMSLCASSRVFLRITPQWYGFVFLVPTYILVAYVLFEWLPSRRVYSRQTARLAIIPIVVIAAHFLWSANQVLAQKIYPVRTSRGLFYDANLGRAAALDAFIARFSAMHAHSLVVVPEGLTLNYLTRTKTSMSYHTFTPVETADPRIEMQIIRDLAVHPPEYIAVVSRAMTDFGYRGFGIDYAERLAATIRQHYTPVMRWRLPSFELILLRASFRDAKTARNPGGGAIPAARIPHYVRNDSGNFRNRFPVAAKIAFATAGAVGGSDGSPVPVGAAVLGMM